MPRRIVCAADALSVCDS